MALGRASRLVTRDGVELGIPVLAGAMSQKKSAERECKAPTPMAMAEKRAAVDRDGDSERFVNPRAAVGEEGRF